MEYHRPLPDIRPPWISDERNNSPWIGERWAAGNPPIHRLRFINGEWKPAELVPPSYHTMQFSAMAFRAMWRFTDPLHPRPIRTWFLKILDVEILNPEAAKAFGEAWEAGGRETFLADQAALYRAMTAQAAAAPAASQSEPAM